jgi:cysteine-rich repeat protein
MSSFLTDEACYPQSEVDKKMAERVSFESSLEGKSVAEMREVLRGVSPDILDDTSLSELKKKVDDLSVLPMSEEMSPNTVHVYTEAKNNFERLTQPVVPEEPVAPVAPVVPEEPVAPVAPVVPAVVPVVPAVPVAPVAPVVPALPVAPVAPVVPAVPAKVPAVPVAPVEPVVPALPVAPVAPVVPAVPAKVPAVPVAPVEPVVPALPVAPVAPVVPAVPKQGTPAYTQYITVTKPAYDAAKKVYDAALVVYKAAKKTYDAAVAAKKKYDIVTKPAYDVARAKYDAAVAAKKEYDTVTKPAYDMAKKAYDAALVVYKAAKKTYDAAVAAKKKYDTVTKPAYDVARAKYDAAVAAKKEYDTVTKPAYDAAKKTYDTVTKPAYDVALMVYNTAVAAKNVYDTVTKPAYDVARAKYDEAVEAKAVYDLAVVARREYDTVTKPAYDGAIVVYNAALAAKSVYDTVTKPKYDADLVVYNTAVTAKKDYDDAAEEFSRIAEAYRQASAPYNTYYEYKVALEEYARAINDLLKTRIGVMQTKMCPANVCGNNIIESPEICDDGNTADWDFCSSDCLRITDTATIVASYCGDGILSGYEACDDGNTNEGDGCSSSCQWSMLAATGSCGNGVLEDTSWEQCDGSFGCSSTCRFECGDSICASGETSGTCPQDCPYDNMGGSMTENKMSVVNECGDMICSESEDEMSCQTDCNSMRPFPFLDMTASQIRTHEFTEWELDELTSENIDQLITFFEEYDRFLTREIEKLQRLWGQYGYCNNDVNCENNIRQKLGDYSMNYSMNHGPLHYFLTNIENFFIPKTFAGETTQAYMARMIARRQADKERNDRNTNTTRKVKEKFNWTCAVCFYGEWFNANDGQVFKEQCTTLIKLWLYVRIKMVLDPVFPQERASILDDYCKNVWYSISEMHIFNHGNREEVCNTFNTASEVIKLYVIKGRSEKKIFGLFDYWCQKLDLQKSAEDRAIELRNQMIMLWFSGKVVVQWNQDICMLSDMYGTGSKKTFEVCAESIQETNEDCPEEGDTCWYFHWDNPFSCNNNWQTLQMQCRSSNPSSCSWEEEKRLLESETYCVSKPQCCFGTYQSV